MTDTPKPATTLSDEERALVDEQRSANGLRERNSPGVRLVAIIDRLDAECVALRERLRVAEEQRDVWAEQATKNESRRSDLEQRLKLVRTIEYAYDPEAGCRCHPMQSGVEPCEYHSGYIDALEAVATALAYPPASDTAPKEAT